MESMVNYGELDVVEQSGGVVDFATGQVFVPSDDWVDFAVRWAHERRRAGRPVYLLPLCDAIHRARPDLMGLRLMRVARLAMTRLEVDHPELCYTTGPTADTP